MYIYTYVGASCTLRFESVPLFSAHSIESIQGLNLFNDFSRLGVPQPLGALPPIITRTAKTPHISKLSGQFGQFGHFFPRVDCHSWNPHRQVAWTSR